MGQCALLGPGVRVDTHRFVNPIPWLAANGRSGNEHSPRGSLDKAVSPKPGTVRVAGWTFDPDAKSQALTIHVYVGGRAGQAGTERHNIGAANRRRDDIASRGAGVAHGFDKTFDTGRRGDLPICAYAINVGPGSNALLGCKRMRVSAPESPPSEDPGQEAPSETEGWFLTNLLDGTRDLASFSYGQTTDQPLAGDWNGDGVDTAGVFRPGNGGWYLTNNFGEPRDIASFSFGRSGDVAVVGDWNGDGLDTPGVYRPSAGTWYLTNNLGEPRDIPAVSYGRSDDTPVVGDWDGDGRDSIGVFRPSDHTWYNHEHTSTAGGTSALLATAAATTFR